MSVRPAIDIHSNMPIRRKYFRGARKIASSWAPQQTVVNVELASGSSAYQTGTFTIVNPIDEEGTRTVAHLRIKLLTDINSFTTDMTTTPFGYTVQYVPAGTTVTTPTWNATGPLLMNNQFCLASGVWNPG